MPFGGRRAPALALLLVLLSLAAPSARAQNLVCDAGDVEVVRLQFEGNRAFSSATLADGIVTTPSSFARRTFSAFGTRRCLDRQQFPLDVVRLILWYRNHGYSEVAVDTVVTPMGKAKIGVRFIIREGIPTLVDSLAVIGLEAVPERDAIVKDLATRSGHPFDKYANETSRDSLTSRRHDGGYPAAEVFVGYDTRTDAHRASVTFTVVPGPRVHFGAILVQSSPRDKGVPAINEHAVRRVAGLRTGTLYSEAELERAKRALYQTEAFSHVSITSDSVRSSADTILPVTLAVTEGYMRAASFGGGWGTLDCVRATVDLTQYNFLDDATRLDMRGRLSKIGVGEPLTGLEAICPQAHSDIYSKDLNYYAGATVTEPASFHGFVPSFSLYSERRSEYNAYLRTTPVGGSLGFTRTLARITQSFAYTVEYGRTDAQPALLCAVFNACEEVDREAFQRSQRLAVASVAVSRETGDNPVNPTRGTVVRFEFRTAGAYTGSDPGLRFNKFLADGAAYVPVNQDIVIAGRLRFGAVLGPSFTFSTADLYIPQQERLFAGGPTTVRGYNQNELGPAVYIPTVYDTVRANGSHGGNPASPSDTVYFRARPDAGTSRAVPTGGDALVVAMIEARIRSPLLPNYVQFTAFTDAGAVLSRNSSETTVSANSLRWTPGLGIRVRTIFGMLRVDVAYNPYARPAGAAYFDAPVAAGGELFCVSPGNTLRVTATASGVLQQAPGACPATFQPPRETSFFQRLTPSVSIGQAF